MKFNRSTRRMFLQGSGGALVSIPFLSSLLPREAWAQTNTTIRRYVSIFTAFETGHHSSWIPNDGSNIYNLPQPRNIVTGVNGHHDVRWQSLREFAPTNSSVLAPYYGIHASPYLESMNILRGLDFMNNDGHSWAVKFGGLEADHPTEFKRVPTVDQVLNANKTFNPVGRPAGTLSVPGSASQVLNADGTVSNAPRYDRYFSTIYNGLFSNGSFPESGQTTIIHSKGNVLNRVIEDYNRVKNSKNISVSDKLTLQNAMDKMSDVQKSLVAVSSNSCQYKTFYSTHPLRNDGMWNVTQIANFKFLADLVTLSMLCDSARTFTIPVGFMADVLDGQAFDHQITSHETFGIVAGKFNWQRMTERQALVFSNFVIPLVKNLAESIDPANGKSLLYNSLVFNTHESAQVHGSGSHPAILFGNAGGNITSGKYIDYSDRTKGAFVGADLYNATPGDPKFSNNWRGVHYNRLLTTILQAMGLTPADYENNTINQQFLNRTDLGPMNMNLTSPIGGFGHAWTQTPVLNTWDYGYLMNAIKATDLKQYRNKLPIL